MSDTPKSPARRQLRKSALQASPFGAPVKSFLKATPSITSSSSSAYSTPTTARIKPVSPTMPSVTATEQAEADAQEEGSTSPLDSPSSRKSARLSNMYKNVDLNVTPKKPPTTPKSKTHLKIGVWGHIVGLKKQDMSEYCRFPIDKSYCSFGRGGNNDVPVPFESVSDMHCKLIRREDGEVWLKDTSNVGTLLNNVLVHDTARPIEHNDIMTIAGRSFRFESTMSTPRPPLQATDGNTTPGRHIKSIQMSFNSDISALAEAPSPTAGRISTTPKRNLSRSTAALESSLGLFTPNSAAKLSSLLVSPKPIPLPAFLKSPRKSTTSIHKPSMASIAATTTDDQQESEDNAGYRTPTKEKRKSPDDFYTEVGRTPKKVSFGPDLNPEIFSKNNPPNTPVKRGEHQPLTASTPSFMAKLAAAGGTPKSILTPSRSSRTNVFHGLEKPTPLKFKLFSPELQKTVTTPKNQARTEQDIPSSASRKSASEQDESASDSSGGNDSDDSLREKIGSASTVSPFIVSTTATELENFRGAVDEEDDDDDESPPSTPTRTPAARQASAGLSTPSRSRLQLSNQDIPEEHLHHSYKLHASPLQPDADNPFISRNELRGDSPSHSPTIAVVQRHHPDMTDAIEEELDTPLVAEAELPAETVPETATPDVDIPDTSPVHTPVRNRTKDDQKSKVTPGRNTPGSASRLALLQLSAQKIRGLPDLLQSTSSTTFTRESTETVPTVPESSTDEVERQDGSADEEVTPVAAKADSDVATEQAEEEATLMVLESGNEVADDPTEDEDKDEEEEDQIPEPMVKDDNESVGDEAEPEADDALAKDHAQYSRVWPSSGADSKRRMSAPAASTILRPQSPIFNGLRGVFRTPQKVVETCFAGFSGFRNFVMTPTRSPKQPSTELFASLPKSESQSDKGDGNPFQVKLDDTKEEEAVETLDVQEITTTNGSVQRGPELSEFTFSIGAGEQKTSAEDNADRSTDEMETAANARRSIRPTSTVTTPKRRISSHKDALALLTGHSGELSPKSKEFTFATDSLEQIKARGRRSDVFPQKRTVAKRSLSQSGDKEEAKNETDDKDGSNRRRRTISMFEFIAAVSPSTTTPITATVKGSSVDAEVESKEQCNGAGDGDDAEQAELLRLLGEGADSGEDEDESANEGVVESEGDSSYDDLFDRGIEEDASSEPDEALLVASVKVSPQRKSESFRSNGSTPTKRRQSFRSRLGSSSPGFGLYEGDEDEEDDEEDEVMMISPKRIRVLE
ncbi:antigen identified by monoclonal antibody Ki-67 [Linnemannia gamsii]|uniref:Antigen identified by monoclonal antibody Ki-67 n=1 Tax=Linnemannia gamsii TaxID=64522 RepID=A0ABQ7K073_9FUNG|nr:antigen identified by monoclonal antibody Ki-67 [Linnemannia gamsii]